MKRIYTITVILVLLIISYALYMNWGSDDKQQPIINTGVNKQLEIQKLNQKISKAEYEVVTTKSVYVKSYTDRVYAVQYLQDLYKEKGILMSGATVDFMESVKD